MSSRERHALILLASLALVGHGARFILSRPGEAPGGVTLLADAPADALERHRERSARAGRPLREGERLDLNLAPAEELARLPRIGMAMAKAIVRHRDSLGGFVALAEMDEVPGVGPRLLEQLAPHLTLGDTSRARARRPISRSPAIAVTPPVRPPVRFRIPSDVRSRSRWDHRSVAPAAAPPPPSGPPVDLNTASETDLLALPGIGWSRAHAIMAYRQANGPFASVWDLGRVPGISRSLVRRLSTQVVVR